MSGSGGAGAQGLLPTKSQKGRRKISLPWFRQNSVTAPHATLSRQHTIDSPGSFRFFRQSSNSCPQAAVIEMTWVVSDYTATPGTSEVSVTKGQQVEVLDTTSSSSVNAEFCLVRLSPIGGGDGGTQEGLVPIAVLKPPPPTKGLLRRGKDAADMDHPTTAAADSNDLTISGENSTANTSSPINKRRGFSGRKWLPPPLRKLSQGRVDKTSASERPLVKKPSDKSFKLPTEKQTEDALKALPSSHSTAAQDLEQEEESTFELPPPMKPIQDSQSSMMANGPTVSAVVEQDLGKRTSSLSLKTMEGNAPTDLEEIEQFVKEKMEQHESKKSNFLTENENSRLSANSSNGGSSTTGENNDDNNLENDLEISLKKREYVLRELVNTEETYVLDLALIVDGYIREIRDPDSDIPIPDDLKGGKERMIFGNVEAIYEWHRDTFLDRLHKLIPKKKDHNQPINTRELGTFIKHCERKLHMYVIYCQNKPVSEHIVAEHLGYFEEIRLKLKHKLVLCDLLIKPVQRIMKYELMLRDILKHTERAGLVQEIPTLHEAIYVMKVVPKAANDMMDVGRLQKFEGKITAQGKLLLHGPLLCTEGAGAGADRNTNLVIKPRELQVFLFEQNIIFSEIVGKKTQFTNPSYIYKTHVQVNKMVMEEMPDNRFLLRSTDPQRQELSFVLTTQTSEQHREWMDTITNILQTQHDFLKAIQSPIAYQKELTKESSVDGYTRNPHLRKTTSIPISCRTVSSPPTPGSVGSGNDKQSAAPHFPQKQCSLPASSSSPSSRLNLNYQEQLYLQQQHKEKNASNNNRHSSTGTEILKLNLHPVPETEGVQEVGIIRKDNDIVSLNNNRPVLSTFVGPAAFMDRSELAAGASGSSSSKEDSLQQRRWSQHQPTSTLTIHDPYARVADKENSDTSSTSPSSNPDKKSLWNFSVSKFSPRRSADISNLEKLNFKKLQQQNSADYVNLPFDFNQALLPQNGNQSPNQNSTTASPSLIPGGIPPYQAPEIVSRSQDCMVETGATAVLTCRIRHYENAKITWRKTEPNPSPIAQSAKFNYTVLNSGEARLMIAQTTMADSGLYVCSVSNRYGTTQCTIGLTVLSSQLDVLTASNIEVVGPTSVRVNWESMNVYFIEHCQIGTMKWLKSSDVPVKSKHILTGGFSAGQSYMLRLVCPNSGVASLPSPAITMPISETHMWQQQQFSNRYAPLTELGRGRFAVLRLASDLVTGQHVALKQVSRRHQDIGTTQEEYKLLASAQHPNIVRGLALFENAPTPGCDTIVMELVQGPLLFNFVCQMGETYTEHTVLTYMRQLVSALHWLHSRKIAHLDVKPENVMINLSQQHHQPHQQQATLKLVDFGEAVRCINRDIVLPPANLEFAAPEMVIGQPLNEFTDSWCFGILLYVFLSGVSPFLDDSIEETTANILKCDFSFPEDYFHDISNDAKNLLTRLLVLQGGSRATMTECQQSSWFTQEPQRKPIPKTKLESFNARRVRNSISMLQQFSFQNACE